MEKNRILKCLLAGFIATPALYLGKKV